MTWSFKTSYMTTHLWFIVFLKETNHMFEINMKLKLNFWLINKFLLIYILLSRMLARGVILILKNTPQIAQYAKRLLWHWIFWMCFSTFVEWKSIKTFLTMEWSITFQNPIKWHNNLWFHIFKLVYWILNVVLWEFDGCDHF